MQNLSFATELHIMDKLQSITYCTRTGVPYTPRAYPAKLNSCAFSKNYNIGIVSSQEIYTSTV